MLEYSTLVFQSNELDSAIVKKVDIAFSDSLPLFYLSQYGNEDFLSELITKACGRWQIISASGIYSVFFSLLSDEMLTVKEEMDMHRIVYIK